MFVRVLKLVRWCGWLWLAMMTAELVDTALAMAREGVFAEKKDWFDANNLSPLLPWVMSLLPALLLLWTCRFMEKEYRREK